MATVTEPTVEASAPKLGVQETDPRRAVEADSRVVLHDVSWSLFQEIVASKGDRRNPLLTYDEGSLEFMSPSYRHDSLARWFDYFVVMVAKGLKRPCRSAGSTRWERAGSGKAKEADASFYIDHAGAVRGLREIDLEIHPPPDLAIEILVSRPLGSSLNVYAALRVPEVWVCDGNSVRCFHLGEEGGYTEHETSQSFPTLRSSEILSRLLRVEEMEQADWMTEVENWAARELTSRAQTPPTS